MKKNILIGAACLVAVIVKADLTIIRSQDRHISIRTAGGPPFNGYVTNAAAWQNLTNAEAIAAANSTTNKP